MLTQFNFRLRKVSREKRKRALELANFRVPNILRRLLRAFHMATSKIAIYSLSGTYAVSWGRFRSLLGADLKNTTDDALPNYLTSLKFKQSHYLTDVRLALGYSAVLIAAVTFYADYKLGWDRTKAATFWAVLVYFTLNGALTCWIWGVEKGNVFTGEIDQNSTGTSLVSAWC